VGKLADVFGTAFGIALTRTTVRVLPAFAALTVGHLYASWREVKAFELPYLNRTRLAYTVRRFLATGTPPASVTQRMLCSSEPKAPAVPLLAVPTCKSGADACAALTHV